VHIFENENGDLACRFIKEFQADMASLNCLPPTLEPKATEHIDVSPSRYHTSLRPHTNLSLALPKKSMTIFQLISKSLRSGGVGQGRIGHQLLGQLYGLACIFEIGMQIQYHRASLSSARDFILTPQHGVALASNACGMPIYASKGK